MFRAVIRFVILVLIGITLVTRWRRGPEMDPGPYLKGATEPVARKAAA